MKKRVLAVILLVTIMVVGCGKMDEEITSKAPGNEEEIVVETEIMDEEDIVSYEEDEGTGETATEVVEESTAETVPTEQVKSEESQKTETKKKQTKTEIPATTTPAVSKPVAVTPEPEVSKETCEHWYQPVFEKYTLTKTMVWACNGCGYPLYTIENGKPVNFSDMYSHPPYETDRYDEPCTGGGFHSEIFISGEISDSEEKHIAGVGAKCALCWGDVIIRDCMFSVMGLRCIHNEILGPYEKIDEENVRGYIKSCDCGENLIMSGSDGGVILLEETCVYCGDTKTYPQK